MIENKVDVQKLKAFVLYEFDMEPDIVIKVNEKTDEEQTVKAQTYKFEFNDNMRVLSFNLPERNLLKEKNICLFEMTYSPLPLVSANYFSPKYSFQMKDDFSYYFMIGLKFQKNEKHSIYKEPPGHAVDNQVKEIYYFFLYIVNSHLGKIEEMVTKGEIIDKTAFDSLLNSSLKQLNDLIEIFKLINKGDIARFSKDTILYFKRLDEFILSTENNKENSELILFAICMVGVFDFDHFINRDYLLKESFILLNLALKANAEIIQKFDLMPSLKQHLINGFYILVNFSIKEGTGLWLSLTESQIFPYLFDEKTFFIRVNEYIRRSGSALKNRNIFTQAKQYLVSKFRERENEMKNAAQGFNAILRNLAILSVNKENLLDTLFEFYEGNLIDTERLRNVKEEIRRKKWQSEDEDNFAGYVCKIKFIMESLQKINEEDEKESKSKMIVEEENKNNKNAAVNNTSSQTASKPSYSISYNIPFTNNFAAHHPLKPSESLHNEFRSLLYDLSSSIRYIFTLMKLFNYENFELILIKRAISSVKDFSLDDYIFILKEFHNIPEGIKKEVIGSTDSSFFERVKSSLKKITLPFEPKSKEVLPVLLLNKDIFMNKNGSLEFVKEFIRNKPDMGDLMFIIRELIIPQRENCEENAFREMFVYVKNYLMSNISEVEKLISCFSEVIKTVGSEEDKAFVCEDLWRTMNQRYSPEVFLGMSQIFNEKEFDAVIEVSYIQYVKSIIDSINTDIQNFEKINQFFNSLCVIDSSSKDKVVYSDNASTEKIITSILDILVKVSEPEKLTHNFLLENPSKENFWYRLIRSKGKFTSFMKHPYIIFIVDQVIKIYESFIKGNLPVSDYITICKFSNISKDAFVSYFISVVRNMSHSDLLKIVEKNNKNLNDNLNIISEVETFFNHYGTKIDKADEITNALKKMKGNFKATPFRDFILPDEILCMKNEIKKINMWSETIIFNNVFDSYLYEHLNKEITEQFSNINNYVIIYNQDEQSENFIGDFERDLTNPEDKGPEYKYKKKNVSLKETFELAEISYNEIKEAMSAMISNNDFSELSLANTMKYFKAKGGSTKYDYIKESELIGNLMSFGKNHLETLKRILKTFCEIAIYIKFCSIMLKLDSVYKFSVNNANVYKEFMDLINNPENSFERIFLASEKVLLIRNKYTSKFDIENLLFELAENRELKDFLINTPDEDIRNMVDAVDEHGDSFIRVQTIRDLLIIGSFIRGIKLKEYTVSRENNPIEEEFVSRIVTAIGGNNSHQNIDALINSCGKQFLGIKHLHNELSNREEASKIKAKEICRESYFEFNFNYYKKNYEVNVSYGKAMKKITFRDLCDLRDRVLLLLYNEKEEIFNEDSEISGISGISGMLVEHNSNNNLRLRDVLAAFIKVVDISEKVVFILNDIYNNGYPVNIVKNIRLKDGEAIPFQVMLGDISNINSQWNEDLKEAYTLYYPLTYYNGNQFWQLECLFTSSKSINHDEKSFGYFLLKFADPDLDVVTRVNNNKYQLNKNSSVCDDMKDFDILESNSNININININNNNNININNNVNNNVLNNSLTPKERIFKLGEALVEVIDPRRNGATAIDFKRNNINRIPLNLKGSHFIFSHPSSLRIYHHLLSVHFSIESALPAANQIFYCTKRTTFHDVIAFLSRFVYCPVARLFTIVRVENLSFELQNFLVDKVNKLMSQVNTGKIKITPFLCLISSDNSSFINTQFAENAYIYQLRDFDVLDENSISKILKSLNLNATTIRSDDTGAGKTFYIRNKAIKSRDKEGTIYINFPLLDAVNIEKTSERLYELNQYSSGKFIHITICGIIDDFEMLDYILFKFIIIGCLKNDIFVSFRDRQDPIYIEISNTFNDYLYNAISILPLLPNEEMIMSRENILSTIDMGKYVFDPIQIVCNYLFYYDMNQLNSTDIHPNQGLNSRIFSKEECLTLLSKFFLKNNPDCTFRQLQIFISILADQLIKFTNNFYFTCENIRFIQNIELADVRSRIMASLLIMTEEFTVRSIKAARDSQNSTALNLGRSITRENLNQEDVRLEEINSLSSVMSWSQSNHLLIMFHEDGYCMTPVYREKNDVPHSVKQLVESQKATLGDYQKLSHTDLLVKLCHIVGREFLEELFIDSDYVMTADNFLKMLLIIIRARCSVPIIIMGETGCGKTSLVRFLATRILNEGFEVINFHAGITESFLIEKMNSIKQKAYDFIDGRIWVFLDEINTCDCMGLITEIITQNSVLGDPLPYNIVFIAACNPYKIRKDHSEVGLIKQRVATKLVYRVHPLPDSLIDYVWDYGSLTENEEKLYISNILSNITGDLRNHAIELVVRSQVFIRDCEDKYAVSLRDVTRFKILHQWFYNMIQEKNEQNAGRADDNNKSSKNNYYSGFGFSSYFNPLSYYSSNIKYTGKLMIARKALILSLMMCYYNRISKNKDRSEYKRIITRFLNITESELEEMINEEQRDIVTRMELPPAIAINKALLENVFTLMVCVINKIPLFICGKPGCSKSLAVQLLVSNLRGQDSSDNFFKKLPRILAIPYQGSESSTSEGIEKIFEKAQNVLKNANVNDRANADKTILPLIVFDEIGLAEISKNNPLKILHSLLEPENAVIAFVGISNWRLDASKMNRAVYLARPDPDLEDLESTALSIFDYYIKEPRFDEKIIMKALAKTYFDFKLEQAEQGYSDFHGTRDFYSLIKQVTKEFNENYKDYNEIKYSTVKDALSRNFGGVGNIKNIRSNSINSIQNLFAKNLNLLESDFNEIPQKSLMELVKENLRDKDSRFLLLFTNGESASYILDNYLKNDLKERMFIIGSEFEGDKEKDEHSFRLLSDIILYMESGSSVILKNLDQIYGSLYDLFNQNFMIVGQKKNCRIALGSTNNPMCFVHDNFHCVVLVDIRDMERMDPPFLNRFEKQVLTFESVLTLRQRNIAYELEKWIKGMTSISLGDNNLENNLENNLAINEMIITYNDEFCPSLALLHYNEEKTNEEIIENCKKEILSVSNISLIVFSVLSAMYRNSREEVFKTHKTYFEEQCHDSLQQFVFKNHNPNPNPNPNSILNPNNNKLIVYTYSNILDEIKFPHNYQLLNIAEIKTEKDFDHRFKIFLSNKDEWLFIKIDLTKEKSHIPMIKFKSDKFLNEYKRTGSSSEVKASKNVIMIVYLSRSKTKVKEVSSNIIESHFLSGWNQIMIDCINGGQIDNFKSLLNLSTIEVVQSNLDRKTISEMVFNIYLKFNFCPHNENDKSFVKEYMTDMLRKIENDSELIEILKKKCVEFLNDSKRNLPDWKIIICCDNKILSRSVNTFSAIRLFVADLIEEPLLKILHYLETESSVGSFFDEGEQEENNNEMNIENNNVNFYQRNNAKRTIWKEILEKKDLKQICPYNAIQSLIINPVFDMQFPFSKSDIYDLSLSLKEAIDNIYILDNGIYHQPENEENKLLLNSEFDTVKRILSANILNKFIRSSNSSFTSSEERHLQTYYINDLLTYFLTNELKKSRKWRKCLTVLVEKFVGLDYDNFENIFVFLWKNKKRIDSLFSTFEIVASEDIFEKFLSNDKLYLKENNIHNRRISEINLFSAIYREIAKVLLSYLNNFDLFKGRNYAVLINSFITSLLNFSFEIKTTPDILSIFVILNESLKILSLIYDSKEEIFLIVKDVFINSRAVHDSTLELMREFKFLTNILSAIDEGYNKKNEVFSREEKDMMQINIEENNINSEFDELKENIINSKLTIFENVLNSVITNEVKSQILSNIIKDVHLTRYSSFIFSKIFSECKIEESFSDLIGNVNMKEVVDSAIELNNINSYDHILFSFMSDFFRKFLSKPSYERNMGGNYMCKLRDYLNANFNNYKSYLELIFNKSKFHNILGFAGLKHYLELYGEYLAESTKYEKDSDLIFKINFELESAEAIDSKLTQVLQNYILKSIMKKLGCNAQALAYINFNEMGIKWINNKLFENNDNLLGIELNFLSLDAIYKENSGLFFQLLNGDSEESVAQYKQILTKCNIKNSDKKSYELRLMIIQFFINKVYLSFSNVNFAHSLTYNHIVEVFEKCTKEIRENLGDQIYNFIYNLVYNFKKSINNNNNNNQKSFFQIEVGIDINKLGVLGFILQSFNLIISSTEEISNNLPYTQIFKQKDSINLIKDLDHLDKLFLPGGFVEFQDENLLIMMKHINESYELYGTQLGLYECSCGYLYTIGDCTRPYYTGKCPNCQGVIGGASHVLSERAGHICLINTDNRSEANRKQYVLDHLAKKLANKSGYMTKMADELPLQYSIRNMSPVMFRWFNLVNHANFLLLIEMGVIQDSQFRIKLKLPNDKSQNYLARDFIRDHVNTDVSKLAELLKAKDSYIMLMVILCGVENMTMHNMNNNNLEKKFYDLSSVSDRTEYETLLETRIVRSKIDNIANEIKDYKYKYSLDKKLSFSKILDENFTDEEIKSYPQRDFLRIFRSTRLSDWEDLKSEFMKFSSLSAKNFQFLKLLIEKFDELSLLSNLYPIIQFTNFMMNLCNYRFTRQEAKEKTIREVIGSNNQVAEKLFKEFSVAWEKIAHKCSQFACKTLPVLERIEIGMPVSFVLIDDRELGYGMYMAAAMQYLGQIQNEVLEALVYLIKENMNYQMWGNGDIHKYSIQKIAPHEIIMYQTEDINFISSITNDFSKFYEIYNGNYGQGTIIQYNFEKIENELAFKLLTNKKILNYEDLSKVQYKFELLSINNKNSNLLNDIQSKIDQKMIHGEEANAIKRTLEKLEAQNVAYVYQIFSSLEIILCNLRYSANSEDCSLSNFIQKIQNADRISFFLRETQPICSVRLSNINSFYELVEERLFKHVVEYVSSDYKLSLNGPVKKLLSSFLENKNRKLLPTKENLVNVIQRFIIRCLVASIEPKFPVKEYLMRRDFWDLDVNEEVIDNFNEEFPDEILIANTLSLLEIIKENKREEQVKEKVDFNQDRGKIDQIRMEVAKKKNKFI